MSPINQIPDEYLKLSQPEIDSRIISAKNKLGKNLVILGHNYQREEILNHADFLGDSYKLCLLAMKQSAKYIVFCGVHFMAESADILSRKEQIVVLPDLKAGCSLADMAYDPDVDKAWKEITSITDEYIPVSYINSTAKIKAFCGKNSGATCTSSNAEIIFDNIFSSGKKIIFFPDEHLGRYAAKKLGISDDDIVLWDSKQRLGGNSADKIMDAKIILWKGFCYVHQQFKADDIEAVRKKFSGIKIIVHPECTYDVLQQADLIGSTEFIIQTVSNAPKGTKWAIGTEIHLVSRLKNMFPDKLIVSLSENMCLCSTMYRINPAYLLWVLEGLVSGNVINQIKVPDGIAYYARIALDRMIEMTGKKRMEKVVEVD